MMRSARALVLALPLALAAACGGGDYDNGYAVNLILKTDSSVDASRIQTLQIDVSGAESTSKSFPSAGKFASGEERVIYRPQAPGGELSFVATLLDAASLPIGTGRVSVTLKPGGTVTATIDIRGDMLPDLAMPDLIMPDLVMPDLAMPDLAMPDLAMPDLRPVDFATGDLSIGSCGNGVKDGTESDVDCGGSCTKKCAVSQGCTVAADCGAGLFCQQGQSRLLCAMVQCGTCLVANAGGTACVPAAVNSDPKNECAVDVPTCKAANCNGMGACTAAPGTPCGTAMCSGNALISPTCDNTGACAQTPTACAPYGCNVSSCFTSCTSQSQCFQSAFCNGSNQCRPLPFTALVSASSPPNPAAVAFADFDRDGRVDMVAASASTGTLATWQGTGSAFTGASSTNIQAPAQWIVTGNFNADGFADIAYVMPSSPPMVVILAGNGNLNIGAWNTLAQLALAANPTSLEVADLNRDGRPGLIVGTTLGVQVVVNNNNTFQAGGVNGIGGSVSTVISADFNLDNKPDVAAFRSGATGFTILLGKGDGTFNAQGPYATTQPVARADVADFNKDGKPDLAATSASGGLLSIFLNQGPGTFTVQPIDYFTSSARGLVAGDFDADGNADVVYADAGPNSIVIVPGRGTGSFGPPTMSVGIPTGALGIFSADFDADSHPDVVVPRGTAITVAVNQTPSQGTLRFTPGPTAPFSAAVQSLEVVDYNLDGKPDLVGATTGNQVQLATGKVGGGFNATGLVGNVAAPPAQLLVADFDRDGIPDSTTINRTSNNATLLWSMVGSGNVGPIGSNGIQLRSAVTADFNRDGVLDFVVVDESQLMALYPGRAMLPFSTTPLSSLGTGIPASLLATGDLTRDGIPDVVVVGSSGSGRVYRFTGTSFQQLPQFGPGGDPRGPQVADLNRDGRPDVVVANTAGAIVSHAGDGSGGLAIGAPTQGIGGTPVGTAIADFNRDGIPDIAVAGAGTNTLYVLSGKGDLLFNAPFSIPTTAAPTAIAAADVNLDGLADVVVTSGTVAQVFLNTSTP